MFYKNDTTAKIFKQCHLLETVVLEDFETIDVKNADDGRGVMMVVSTVTLRPSLWTWITPILSLGFKLSYFLFEIYQILLSIVCIRV